MRVTIYKAVTAFPNPLAILVAMLVLSGAAVIAAYLPARRASRVDPVIALRYQ